MSSSFRYRPALDGIRALSVIAVLLFHGGVSWLPGGFLGVDAFFVLSGFLITSLLLSEHAAQGRIRLGAFWVRRLRRLAPALLLVLAAVVVTYRDLLSTEDLALLRTDALAALGYVANWRMIYRGDDYFAQTSTASPLQHTWSLGIEEQFYVLWPLLVAGVLVLAAARARRVLIVVSLLGAAASALTAALLFQPLNVDRAYFGTDTRAQALLLGCALAAVLSRQSTSRPQSAGLTEPSVGRPGGPGRGGRRAPARSRGRAWLVGAATVAGCTGAVGVAWLWAHANGTDAWLYRGGFTVGALAVAAVIGHVMLSPEQVVGRILSVAPLVWIGRISYGVYLWHWPLYGLLNGDRTGLRGPTLLALRLAVTLVVALASYVLVERPIRTGRWPLRLRLPRPTRRWATAGATVAAGLTALLIVAATVPPPVEEALPRIPVPTVEATNAALPVRTPPMLRPDRLPGAEPRITFFGDSVSWSLGTYLPPQQGVVVSVRAVQGCGIARLPDVIQLGEGHSNYPACPTWDVRWRRGIEVEDPDVSVILLDRWELMDRKLDGVYQHVGQPGYDAYLMTELELAVSIAGSRGAQVVLLTAPYTRRAERPDGGLYDEDLPERVDAWNALLRQMAARYPQLITVLDLNARVCPDGEFTWAIDRLRIRSDGLHFTPEGVRAWIAPWLMPQLTTIATGSIYTTKRGD